MTRPVVGSPDWRVVNSGGLLVATRGADDVLVVDDVPGDVADELARCWSDAPPTPDQLGPRALLAVEQLRAVGVFGTPLTVSPAPRLALCWSGDRLDAFEQSCAAIAERLGWPAFAEPGTGAADLELVVRTTTTLLDAATAAADLLADDRIHLLCDVGSAHTIAVGPLVVPGHTSCLSCLAGRIVHRWGDPEPPAVPAVSTGAGPVVAAGLAMHHVRLATQGRFPLVDATLSWDLDTGESRLGPCLRSPECELCGQIVTDGKLALPWLS